MLAYAERFACRRKKKKKKRSECSAKGRKSEKFFLKKSKTVKYFSDTSFKIWKYTLSL